MLFAETDSAIHTLYVVLIGLIIVATQIAKEIRDSLRAKNVERRATEIKAALEQAQRDAADKSEQVKRVVEEVACKTEQVKTAQIINSLSTAGKLSEVKKAVEDRAAIGSLNSEKLDKVKAALDDNTVLTFKVQSLVNTDREKILTHVKALQTLMEDHGIECPPHIDPKSSGS